MNSHLDADWTVLAVDVTPDDALVYLCRMDTACNGTKLSASRSLNKKGVKESLGLSDGKNFAVYNALNRSNLVFGNVVWVFVSVSECFTLSCVDHPFYRR